MIIAIMGLTGAGKSTVSKLLASRLDAKLFDMDIEFPEEYAERRNNHELVPAADVKNYQKTMVNRMLEMEVEGTVVLAGFFLDAELPIFLSDRTDMVWINLVTDDKELLSWRIHNRGPHFPSAQKVLDDNWERRDEQMVGDYAVDCGLPLEEVVGECMSIIEVKKRERAG